MYLSLTQKNTSFCLKDEAVVLICTQDVGRNRLIKGAYSDLHALVTISAVPEKQAHPSKYKATTSVLRTTHLPM